MGFSRQAYRSGLPLPFPGSSSCSHPNFGNFHIQQALPTPSLSGPGTPLLQRPANPLQYSGLEDLMVRGAWRARIQSPRVAHDWSDLSRMHNLHGQASSHFSASSNSTLSVTLLLTSLRKLKASKSRPRLYMPAPRPRAAPLFCWISQEGEAGDGCPAQNCPAENPLQIYWKWKLLGYIQLCDCMDYTVHGILQARILEWVAYFFSSGSSWPGNWTGVSSIAGEFFMNWAMRGTASLTSGPPIINTNYIWWEIEIYWSK